MKINTQFFNTVGGLLLSLSILNAWFTPFDQDEKKRIVFFGDSITAGYGLSTEQAFPALIQQKIDSSEMAYQVINAGLSGETSAGGLSRIDWILKTKPDIFILELGGNDGLRGLSLDETEKNLTTMIQKVRGRNPEVVVFVAGMQIPPNLGQEYTERFRTLFSKVAKANKTELIPFLLENVGGEPELNLPDGIHPNVEGHQIVATTVWQNLKKHLD
ncbi:arylesterase [Roseivirga sp. E12]|uniref:arylesterase n=1 Tax=Roseivirga sp. E12 TaxID=2819237 RepID=UPI001ABC6F97|nr:arylesterase [Roseivirga sp. E12]MBO3699629.1 arylesterase [Roseivirga sp. E12]